jgi:peptidoglycan/LPS O-acetylase OafA/YrhL
MGLIRFLLACGVVLSHTSTIMGYSPLAGNLAVQCFYIISGFYMAMVLTEKYNEPGAKYEFYTNRALKIYPTYWLNLVLLVVWNIIVWRLHYPSTFDFYTKYAHPSLASIIYFALSNLLILGLDWTFLFGINKGGDLYFTSDFNKTRPSVYNFAFNSIACTVGVELAFYVIAPWLNKRSVYTLLALFVASLALRLLLAVFYKDHAPWNYMFFPTQLVFFIAGIFSYRGYIKFIKGQTGTLLLSVAAALLVIVVLLYYQFFQETYTKQIVLFLCVTLFMPFTFELTKKSRVDRFLGNLSYPVYISQALIIRLVSARRFPKIIDVGFTALILVLIMALLINILLINPIEKYKAQRVALYKKARLLVGSKLA